MRVLGIAGSPRRGGNTDTLLAEVLRGAVSRGAETKTLILSDLKIVPCSHCDTCFSIAECIFKDDMEVVLQELEQADAVVFASPIQFAGVSAQMKIVIDRFQALWVRKYKLKLPPLKNVKERKGLFVSVAGRKTPDGFNGALATIRTVFFTLNITDAGALLFAGVDEKGAIMNNPEALKQVFEAGERLVS